MIERNAHYRVNERQLMENRLSLPLRPEGGIIGRSIGLIANYFQVTSLPAGEIVQYDVTVNPDVPRSLRRRLFTELCGTYYKSEFGGHTVAYDGMATAYSWGPLPKDQLNLRLQVAGCHPDKGRDFSFKICRVNSVNLEVLKKFIDGKLEHTPHEAINALEVILRHPLCWDNLLVGRSVFDGKTVESISGAVDMWTGYFISLRPSFGRLLLNVDTSSSCFIATGNVVSIIREFLGIPKQECFDSLHPRERTLVEHFLRSVRIEVTHREGSRRKYTILGLSPTSAAKTFFEDQAGKKSSVADYFSNKYNLTLEYPRMPCLIVSSNQRSIFLPMEVCRVPAGQRYMHKLNDTQVSDIIKLANCRPQDRLDAIVRGKSLLQQCGAFFESFKMQFGNDLLTIKGRVLDPPKILYGRQSREAEVTPSGGVWSLRDKAVELGCTINSWSVLVFGRANEGEVQTFIHELVVTAEDIGLNVDLQRPPILFATPQVESSVRNAYSKAQEASGQRPQFILCILPTDNAGLYGDIKRCSDTIVGLPSQCMLLKYIRYHSKHYCANLCLKINVKLGGVNSSLGRQLRFIVERPTMVFGADVTHTGAGEDDKPSVAAIVGSMDIKLSRYAASTRVQNNRTEIIEDMRDMAREQIQHFVALNHARPHRILFYRDGISEGQFAQVLDFELSALKAACKEIDPAYSPKITFVLVKKRHHTRLFVASPQDADSSGNVPAGTVIDTAIVHPSQFDFFLYSHASLQGTSRPCHYHVVHDENGFSADELQQLSYHMCYTFARCTRSVSVVPAAYYAHLAAFRARFHFGGRGSSDTFSPVKPELATQMYFI